MKHLFLITGLFFLMNVAFSQTDVVKHRVKSKETLYSISKDYGVTINEILKANDGLDVNIKEGQLILIPKIHNDKEYIVFHVTSKTNLRKVAVLYNVSQSVLEYENPGLDFKLYPGQKVKIPVGNKTLSSEEKIDEHKVLVETDIEPEKEQDDAVVFKSTCNTETPNLNKTFKVALMIPLYLDLADSIHKQQFLANENDDFTPFRFIGFYEGAMMAVDSLRKLGMNINLYVYDVDDNPAKTTAILQKPEIRQMDLIIGPFLSKSFDQAAFFAEKYNIPIVNPLSFREEIVQKYGTVLKVKPGNSSQDNLVAALIERDFHDARVYLIKQSAYQDAGELLALQQTLQNSIPQIHKISNRDIYNWISAVAKKRKSSYLPTVKLEGVSINPAMLESRLSDSSVFENSLVTINYSTDSLHLFYKSASSLRNSLVIIYGDNKSFVMDVMNRLNKVRDTFNVRIIGLPNWERFTNLDNNQCNDMKLVYLSSTYTDYDLPKTERFNYYFRQRYATEPGEYAFSGFDLTYFFLYSLLHFDKHFSECIENLRINLFQSTYHFKQLGETQNFENTYWNILQYNQFRLKKLPDPLSSN